MSIYGVVSLFTERPVEDREAVFRTAVDMALPKHNIMLFQHRLLNERQIRRAARRAKLWPGEEAVIGLPEREEEVESYIGWRGPPGEAIPLLNTWPNVHIMMGHTELGDRFLASLQRLAPEVIGNAQQAEPNLSFGLSTIVQEDDDPVPAVLGVPECSFSFFGYGCPNDWAKARRLIAEMPIIHEVREKLEPVTGSLEFAAVWSA